jgi:hypothetical protein
MKFEVGCKLGTQIGPAVGPQFFTQVCKRRKGTQFRVRGGDALRRCKSKDVNHFLALAKLNWQQK